MTDLERHLLSIISQLLAGDGDTPATPCGAPQSATDDAPIGEYVIIRGTASGCHAGTLVSADYATQSVHLRDARRLWRYRGCETLSELAVYGASTPAECRFAPTVTDQRIIGDVCEIIVCQPSGRTMIVSAPEWRA